MPFIGNQPALSYTSFAKQDFTTSATTSYVLDNPVANANELALFINFVRQEPTTAYSASGTSLTLTSATSASDDMYCVYLGKAVQTVNPPNASVGLSQLTATGTKDATTFLRGDNTFASAGGTNTPAFEAYLSANADISNTTDTKVNCNTEVFDTDSAYDNSSNYRFTVPSGEAGKYYVYGTVSIQSTGGVSTNRFGVGKIYKNGSVYRQQYVSYENNYGFSTSHNLYAIMDLSVGDYVELYITATMSSGAPRVRADDKGTYFGGYKIIE